MNQLQNEKSPYLLQHKDNPVDWYPWGNDAFARARSDNKLIFLSIGYSTCHWCHVMAHESFEVEDVARLLNRDYVSVKVDREERPDLDQVYMEVCQRLTGRGGWPLTIIMTPAGEPFYAATYLPKEGRQGVPGMMDLLPWIVDKWHNEPAFLVDSAKEVVALLRHDVVRNAAASLDRSVAASAVRALKQAFDPAYGGFSQAPKFPRPHDLTFLLNRFEMTGDSDCLSMAERTLLKMRCGGIYDQLGGGFHRYSTDKRWLVPHFEKMLYDQAGLIGAYLLAWKLTEDPLYAMTVKDVIAYLQRDMLAAEGGFFSAEDADSEGEEGKFYLWAFAEIEELLGEDCRRFCRFYNVTEPGNYHDEMTRQLTGRNILHLSAEQTGDASSQQTSCHAQRDVLFLERQKRTRPHLDDKIITAWNGMALSALAESGRLLADESYIEQACALSEFVMSMLYQHGRLLRRYRDGDAAIPGFAEDYAFMARGLLDLYTANFDVKHLRQSLELGMVLREFFQDSESGRLYDTPSDGEQLLVRPSSAFDGATPSAASVAVELFARLFLLTGDASWQRSAQQLLQSLSPEVARYPAGFTQLLQAAAWLLEPTREVVIVGNRQASATAEMLAVVRSSLLSQTVVLFKSPDKADGLMEIAPFVGDMRAEGDEALAYVCESFACTEPLRDPLELAEILRTIPASS